MTDLAKLFFTGGTKLTEVDLAATCTTVDRVLGVVCLISGPAFMAPSQCRMNCSDIPLWHLHPPNIRAVPESILGGGAQALFVL